MSTEKKKTGGVCRYYGKLNPLMLADLDGLLLKMRTINKKALRNKTIKRTEIKALPEDDYLRLWGYLRHCCSLVITWPNVKRAIETIAFKSGRTFDDLSEECIDSMTTHVYTYAWRKYKHSEDCGYVFSTAEYGYKAWVSSQNLYHRGGDAAMELFMAESRSCGCKISNVAIDHI